MRHESGALWPAYPSVRAAANGRPFDLSLVPDGYPANWNNQFWRYDLDTGTGWESIANYPFNGYDHQLGAIGGKLYAVGGRASTSSIGFQLDRLYEYDPNANTWTQKASMATKRFMFCATVLNGHLYATGGIHTSGGVTKTMESYDPVTDMWTSRASMSYDRENHACGAINGKLWVAGGLSTAGPNGGAEVLSHVESYDPSSDTWTTQTALPATSMNNKIGVSGGDLYVFAGRKDTPWNEASAQTDVWRWDASADAWVSMAPKPELILFGIIKNTDE